MPGNPTFVVQSEPGAGGLNVANRLANTSPNDGSVLALIQPGTWQLAIQGEPNARFIPRKMTWIGSFSSFAHDADHLAALYGDPRAAAAFADMPVVIVGYSGGFVPTAWSLEVGGLGDRVRGVFLLDAVYGELDKFASWIENNRSGFFVSSYTHYTERHDRDLIQMLKAKGITVTRDMDAPLHPGSVVFVETPEGVTHRNYVTHAWTEDPVREVLKKMAATPALTRVATTGIPSPAGR